jgi:signal transduction histidine kinase
MDHTPIRVLLVEDSPTCTDLVRRLLASRRAPAWAVDCVDQLAAGLQCLAGGGIEVVLLDLNLPDSAGADTLLQVRRQFPEVPIVVLTTLDDEALAVGAVQEGAQDYLIKGKVDGDLLVRALRYAIERSRRAQLEEQVHQQNQELRRKNLELEEQSRRAHEASRLKSEFLASMSHELRTPLNGIIGFAELMYDGRVGPLAPQHREYLGDILTSGRHLLALLNDILDLAKVESGKMELRPEPIDLPRLVGEIRDILRTLAARKRIAVSIDIDAELGPVVLDPAKLKQVLYNYLSNALKFTPDGGQVTIRIRPEDIASFRLEVADTGAGIRAEDLDRLFVEFHKLNGGPTGTGLGLALTKRIVEFQGGRVGVCSTPGRGSVFFAVVPRIAEQASTVGS